ncbi:unnamed protein product [Closterium sp. Yama58-4]|nr:unnamed protein product [Closterium sp. Yama58-4]
MAAAAEDPITALHVVLHQVCCGVAADEILLQLHALCAARWRHHVKFEVAARDAGSTGNTGGTCGTGGTSGTGGGRGGSGVFGTSGGPSGSKGWVAGGGGTGGVAGAGGLGGRGGVGGARVSGSGAAVSSAGGKEGERSGAAEAGAGGAAAGEAAGGAAGLPAVPEVSPAVLHVWYWLDPGKGESTGGSSSAVLVRLGIVSFENADEPPPCLTLSLAPPPTTAPPPPIAPPASAPGSSAAAAAAAVPASAPSSLFSRQPLRTQLICQHTPAVVDPETGGEVCLYLDPSRIDVEKLVLFAARCSAHAKLARLRRDLLASPLLCSGPQDLLLSFPPAPSRSSSRSFSLPTAQSPVSDNPPPSPPPPPPPLHPPVDAAESGVPPRENLGEEKKEKGGGELDGVAKRLGEVLGKRKKLMESLSLDNAGMPDSGGVGDDAGDHAASTHADLPRAKKQRQGEDGREVVASGVGERWRGSSRGGERWGREASGSRGREVLWVRACGDWFAAIGVNTRTGRYEVWVGGKGLSWAVAREVEGALNSGSSTAGDALVLLRLHCLHAQLTAAGMALGLVPYEAGPAGIRYTSDDPANPLTLPPPPRTLLFSLSDPPFLPYPTASSPSPPHSTPPPAASPPPNPPSWPPAGKAADGGKGWRGVEGKGGDWGRMSKGGKDGVGERKEMVGGWEELLEVADAWESDGEGDSELDGERDDRDAGMAVDGEMGRARGDGVEEGAEQASVVDGKLGADHAAGTVTATAAVESGGVDKDSIPIKKRKRHHTTHHPSQPLHCALIGRPLQELVQLAGRGKAPVSLILPLVLSRAQHLAAAAVKHSLLSSLLSSAGVSTVPFLSAASSSPSSSSYSPLSPSSPSHFPCLPPLISSSLSSSAAASQVVVSPDDLWPHTQYLEECVRMDDAGDITIIPRGPFSFRIVYRHDFAIHMRCFAPDFVWLQPAPPPKSYDLPPGLVAMFPEGSAAVSALAETPNGAAGSGSRGGGNRRGGASGAPTPGNGYPNGSASGSAGAAAASSGVIRGDLSLGGSLPCPQFRPFILEQVSLLLSQLDRHAPDLPPLPAAALPPAAPAAAGPESHTAMVGLSDEGGYGGAWVPVVLLKRVLRSMLRYLGTIALFARFPSVLAAVLGPAMGTREAGLLSQDPEQPALRFFIGNYVYMVNLHRHRRPTAGDQLQLMLQVVNARMAPQRRPPAMTPDADVDMSPAELAEISDLFTRKVAVEPFDVSRLSSFVTLVMLPLAVIRGAGAGSIPTIPPAARIAVDLCFENRIGLGWDLPDSFGRHSGGSSGGGVSAGQVHPGSATAGNAAGSGRTAHRSDISYSRAESRVDFSLVLLMDHAALSAAHLPVQIAGGAGWLAHCISVRLRLHFSATPANPAATGAGAASVAPGARGPLILQLSLLAVDGSHGGKACWSKAEDWDRCKQLIGRAVKEMPPPPPAAAAAAAAAVAAGGGVKEMGVVVGGRGWLRVLSERLQAAVHSALAASHRV